MTLMQEFKVVFDVHDLMLTFAAAAGKDVIDVAYDVPRLVPVVDRWHLMTYDYHGAWEKFTHHHATLCGYYLDPEEYETFNVVGNVWWWRISTYTNIKQRGGQWFSRAPASKKESDEL